ncbi:hypothetical protein EV127DRAFT_113621 [Xylaria flabelliformis]|nr:hypothetical protein EV127DRAFT_113621 [Xylaria flabelliformis]
MEAFTALGVAVNIAQVIDYGFKIIQKSRDLRERGVTDPALNDDAQRLHKLTTDLISQGSSKCSGSLRGLAIECAKVSQALIIELKKLQPSDPKSKLQRAKAIWERKFKEGLIAELERRLQDHKGQLSLHLTSLSRIEFNDKLDEINLDMRGMKSELTAMHLAAKELINSDHIGQAISEALRPLIQQYNDYLCQWSELVILDMLHFPDMHERFDTIPDAHRETLHWLLSATHDKHSIKTKANNDSVTWLGQEITPDKETLHWLLNTTTDEHSIRNKASNDFITWLRQGSGFFHISGKPGSGKSTMMKYVCSHHGLEDHLNVWCHDAQLCLGQFFFWKPGSLAQKSIKGLLRGLLYSILDKNRNLIPTVFPNLWKRILHTRSSTSRQLEYRDFQQGFDNLLKYALDSGSYKFVLFIDGLDEFEGQHLDLITTMKEWTEKYPLKICVSSREYGVFLQSFLSYPKLRLHECNFVDIERMTSARLKSNPLCADLFDSDEVLQKIVDLITTRADGVFIWVSIVLAGLEDAMISGASLPELLERIDAYPRELDNLYWHLVHLIHETDRRWAFRVLKMVHFSKSQWKLFTRTALRNISLLQLSFLDDIQYDITAGFPKASALHPESISRRLENTYKKVYGRCKGFLDVIQDHNSYVPRAMAPQVVLTHRSLVEFLETPSFIEEARPYISDSDCFSNNTWRHKFQRRLHQTILGGHF